VKEKEKDLDGSATASPSAKRAPRILHLTLHRKWFDAIATGQKVEEYRQPTAYWGNRLLEKEDGVWIQREFDEIHFRNGYSKGMPWMRVEWKGMKPGTWEGREVMAIQLGKVLEIKNWNGPAAQPRGEAPAEPPQDSPSPSSPEGQ
jgi:hypothetical protein